MTLNIDQIPLLSKLAMTQGSAMGQAEAVTRHLQRLLNTRQGESLSSPEYGLVDLVDLLAELPHTADQIGRNIELCIRKFEPRIMVHAVTLTHDAPRHTLHFSIEASLIGDARRRTSGQSMQLSARLDEHGRIEVGP